MAHVFRKLDKFRLKCELTDKELKAIKRSILLFLNKEMGETGVAIDSTAFKELIRKTKDLMFKIRGGKTSSSNLYIKKNIVKKQIIDDLNLFEEFNLFSKRDQEQINRDINQFLLNSEKTGHLTLVEYDVLRSKVNEIIFNKILTNKKYLVSFIKTNIFRDVSVDKRYDKKYLPRINALFENVLKEFDLSQYNSKMYLLIYREFTRSLLLGH